MWVITRQSLIKFIFEIIKMTWNYTNDIMRYEKARKYMFKLGNFLKRISLIRIPQVLPVSTHCSSSFNSFFSNILLKINYNELLLLLFIIWKRRNFVWKENWLFFIIITELEYFDIYSAWELQIYIFCIEELNIIMLKTRFFFLQF